MNPNRKKLLLSSFVILLVASIVFWSFYNKQNKTANGFKKWASELQEYSDTSNEDLKVIAKFIPSEIGFVNYLGDKLNKKSLDSFYKSGNDSINYVRLTLQRNYLKSENAVKNLGLEKNEEQIIPSAMIQVFVDNKVIQDGIIEMQDEKGIAKQMLIPISNTQAKVAKDIIIMHKYRPVRVIKIKIEQLIPNNKPKLKV